MTAKGTYECPICLMEFPHCHSRKEVEEGTVDLRTSTWWMDAFLNKLRCQEKTRNINLIVAELNKANDA